MRPASDFFHMQLSNSRGTGENAPAGDGSAAGTDTSTENGNAPADGTDSNGATS